MGNTLTAVFRLNDQYSLTMKTIIRLQDEFEKQQTKADNSTARFNQTLSETKSKAGLASGGIAGFITKLGGIISVAYLGKKALDAMFSAVNTSALQKVQETTFQALLHSKQAGTELYSYISEYAKVSALGREDIAQGVTSALTVTRDIGQIEQFVKMVERLYAKDPTKGSQQAVFSLKELLAGDTVSARGVYGITGISGEKIREMMSSGDTQGAFDYISAKLDQFGATQEVVTENFGGLNTQLNIFTSNLKTEIGEQATPVMETLAGVVRQLNADMEAGKFQPFINLMVNGMRAVGNALAWVAENADWLIPILGGVMVGFVTLNIALKAAALIMPLFGIATQSATGNLIAIGVAAAAAAVTIAGLKAAMNDIESDSGGLATNLEEAKKLAGESIGNTAIPVEVANEEPLKVSGTVDIEQENMKYVMDVAGKKFFAEYSTKTLAPQINIHNPVIEKSADADEVLHIVESGIVQASETGPEGAYM